MNNRKIRFFSKESSFDFDLDQIPADCDVELIKCEDRPALVVRFNDDQYLCVGEGFCKAKIYMPSVGYVYGYTFDRNALPWFMAVLDNKKKYAGVFPVRT